MQVGVIRIHYRPVGEAGPAIVGCSVLTMDMTEQMQARRHLRNPLQHPFRAIVDIVVEIQNTVWRRVGDKHIGIGRDSRIMLISVMHPPI